MKYIYLILIFLISSSCFADVYSQTDEEGNITYSDVPMSKQAKKLSTTEINKSSSVQNSREDNARSNNESTTSSPIIKTQKNDKKPYSQFSITSPMNEETIQNQPVISVTIKIEPELQQGDKIQIFLDGAPWGEPSATTHFGLPQPDRGIHTISAKLLDNKQLILKQSNAVRVYIHQAHIATQQPGIIQKK